MGSSDAMWDQYSYTSPDSTVYRSRASLSYGPNREKAGR